ncbi:MAG: efflux RND transporter periplasmic adaptor subunit, partial [Myxococcales bacterium]|nr:efflux RND transporter periplasmic adaptor subunit [Myxococcales bacterium]
MRDQLACPREPAPTARPRTLGASLAWLLVAGVIIGGCKKPETETKKDDAAAQAKAPVGTKFKKVEERSVSPRLEVNGSLDPDERSEVSAQTSGVVLSVKVDVGTRVKKGDLLVELDSKEAGLRLEAANASTASQRARLGLKGDSKFDADSVADVKAAKETRDMANTDYERTKMLFESGAISKSQYDQAKSAKERADASYDSARNGAEQAWVALLGMQSQAGLSSKSVDDTKVRAPFDGVVDAKRIAPGEFAGLGRVVAVLVREDPLRFRFDVPEGQSSLVTVGNSIDIRVAAFPEKVFKGEVKRVGAMVKSQTRTLPIEAEVPNDDNLQKPGFIATRTVQLVGETRPVLMVPTAALVPVTGGSKVYVKNGDKVIERLVVAGHIYGD